MVENNDFNLVISDEENTNLVSNRTLQNTLSPPSNSQFVRRTGDKNKDHNNPQNRIVSSPQFTETFGSGSKDQMNFPVENYFSPKPHWDDVNTYGSYEGFSTESNKKGQFVKKSRRQQSEEVYVADDDQYPEISHREEYGEAHGYQGNDNQEYEGHQEGYGRDHERMIKTTSDRFEGDYGDFQGMGGSQEFDDDDERKVQSLRDSQLSGPVRYSKMSEEEAARAFENRKKELFSNYLKKPPPKRGNSKPGSPGGEAVRLNNGEQQRIQDDNFPGGKAATANFIIFNNKDNKVPNQPPGTQTKASGAENAGNLLNVKRVPSSGKKEAVPLAKQRKDSPASRKTPTPQSSFQKQQQPLKNQKAPVASQQNTRNKEATRPQKASFRDEPPQHNSQQRNNQPKNRNEQYREYYSRQIEEVTETNESQYERQKEAQPAGSQEYNNVYFINKMKNKNTDIMSDIHNLDEEISRLENETGVPNAQQGRNAQNSQRGGYGQQQNRGRPDEGNNTPSQKGNYGAGSWKNTREQNQQQQRPQQQRQNSAEKRQNRSPSNEREKRQRLNELQQGEYRTEGDTHRDPIKEHIYQSYAVLNEKGYEHHYDYLYERALIQKRNKELLQETSKNAKEHQEVNQCTFKPQINQYANPRKPDIITQTKNWQLEKEKQFQANEKHKIERELKDCTFYPNGMLEKEERLIFNPNDFYKRNIEWQKRKEAEDMRKQTELYKSMMSAPEKPKSQVSVSFSRVNESQNLGDRLSPSGRTSAAGKLFRDNSNKSLRSTQERNERSNSAKKKEPLKNIKNRPSYNQNDRHRSPRAEKPLQTQENAQNNNKKNLSSLNLQSQIMESYAILDNLQHMLTAKEKEKHQKIVIQKENVDKKLKTIAVPKPAQENNKLAPRGTQGKASNRPTASPHQSPRTSTKLSMRNPPTYETKPTEEFVQTIVVRKNRYFIEEKPAEKQEKSQQQRSKERSRSIDNRKSKRGQTPTKEFKLTDNKGSYTAAANTAKQRKESPFKSNPVTRNYETSASKSVYSDIKGSPWKSVLHSPQSEIFHTGPSPRYEPFNNYGSTKGVTSPTSQALEKKYLDLLNQVSRVTKQLDHFNVENATLQEDISLMQRKQLNSNLLYS